MPIAEERSQSTSVVGYDWPDEVCNEEEMTENAQAIFRVLNPHSPIEDRFEKP